MNNTSTTFCYGEQQLTVAIAMCIANDTTKGIISEATKKIITNSEANVASIVQNGSTVYGINTGFGPLCDTIINTADTVTLQHNLLLSHAVGVGSPIPTVLAKLMLITKVQALAQGYSGVSLAVINRLLWHINNNVIPVVPCKGSVGASGDLAPLSHLVLPLIGYGSVCIKGIISPAADVLATYNLTPINLQAKEGLGLINGTQFILAHAVYAVHTMQHLLNVATTVGAMSVDALMGSIAPFHPKLHALRPYKGTVAVAHHLWHLLQHSPIVQAHNNCSRVQDPYSIRCIPQVHGASVNALTHLAELTLIELNSVTDNPIIFSDSETISGGNFHGQPLAIPLDYCTVAAAEIGNISDRRCYLMLEGKYGLPKLLIENAGLQSGYMIPQYTTAALVTENKTMCYPASADSIPTSLGQEDHVSMGSISGRKLLQVLDNLTYILAIELMYATQAIELRRPLQTSTPLEKIISKVRAHVSHLTIDRFLQPDIETLYLLLKAEENFALFENTYALAS